MACWTSMLRRFEFAFGEARPAEAGEPDSCRLRALPNEDLHLYRKKIDNSRLVRQADPRATGECLSTIAAVSAVAVVAITTLVPTVTNLISGYQIQSLRQEQQRLINDGRALEVEEARLQSTERLEQLAREQGMVIPLPGQVFHFHEATAGTVAANRPNVDD